MSRPRDLRRISPDDPSMLDAIGRHRFRRIVDELAKQPIYEDAERRYSEALKRLTEVLPAVARDLENVREPNVVDDWSRDVDAVIPTISRLSDRFKAALPPKKGPGPRPDALSRHFGEDVAKIWMARFAQWPKYSDKPNAWYNTLADVIQHHELEEELSAEIAARHGARRRPSK